MMKYIVVHNPHSSTAIPSDARYFDIDLGDEITLVTDHAIPDLFKGCGDETVTFPWSRIWCDVERFDTDPLDDRGQGFFYTKTLEGQNLRDRQDIQKVTEAYLTHHKALSQAVEAAVSLTPVVVLDAHSFSDYQASFACGAPVMPDFCLGFNTPSRDVRLIGNDLSDAGYTVGYNSPFKGAIESRYHIKHPEVTSIMIEVNKRLYMAGNDVISSKVERINKLLIHATRRLRDDA